MAEQPRDLKVIEVRDVQFDAETCCWDYTVVWSSGLITTGTSVECLIRLDPSAVQPFTDLLSKLRKESTIQRHMWCSICRVEFDEEDKWEVHQAQHKKVQEFLLESNEWDFKLNMEEETLTEALSYEENHLEYSINDMDFSDNMSQGSAEATSEQFENCINGNGVGQKRRNESDMDPAKKQKTDNLNAGANRHEFSAATSLDCSDQQSSTTKLAPSQDNLLCNRSIINNPKADSEKLGTDHRTSTFKASKMQVNPNLSNRIGVFESVDNKPRRNLDLLPLIRPSTSTTGNSRPNKEWFPVGNARLNQELHMVSDHQSEIPSEYLVSSSDMAVVKVQPTEYLKGVFNAKLASQKIPKNKKLAMPRKKNQDEQVESSDTDLDGRLIPTFTELFFPRGKTEIYDLMLRDFLSTSGVRAGGFSAEFKSRVLTGFIARNHEFIFQNGLGDMFQKHIEVIALNTPGWKKEHYDAPRNKYFELKAEWNNSQALV